MTEVELVIRNGVLQETGVPVTLSHHQCTGAANFGKAPATLDVIDRRAGRRRSDSTRIRTARARRPSTPDAPSRASASW